jgi:8-oxo-dGTP pyrophosphatase MutT (NUDIX family)
MLAEPRAEQIPVVPVKRVALRFEPRPWSFAEERRAEIAAYFETVRKQNPKLWNGRVLLVHRHEHGAGVLRGACLECDFASFLAWRDWGFPDLSMRNCFGMAALRSSDGAFLLGVMGPHTANAGKCYFPAGTLDPGDIVAGQVDIESSVRKELAEETGLDAAAVDFEPDWCAVFAGARIALMKVTRSRENAEVLRERILRHIVIEPEPELADIRIVRDCSDLDAAVPAHTVAFLNYVWTAARV